VPFHKWIETSSRKNAVSIRAIRETWNDREALRLSNGVMEAVALPGGGHLVELRLTSRDEPGINCLWTPPWTTADPGTAQAASLIDGCGGDAAARFLAGYAGHALCLDLFGPPAPQEEALGVALHGEAAVHEWSFEPTSTDCAGSVDLPVAKLRFKRNLSVASDAAVIFIEERIESRGVAPREMHWVQHLTLGPPLVATHDSSISASLDRGMTWPLGYEGHEVLRDNAAFAWPDAPTVDGDSADLRLPFARRGTGFLAAARVTPGRDFAFIAALNFRVGLALIYCFRRRDFPWVAIWEENCARTGAPWNGTTQARGMEFGTTPMPIGRDAMRAMGTLLDTPSSRMIAPGGSVHARYFAAVARIPADWRAITDVQPEEYALRIFGEQAGSTVEMPVNGLLEFLKGEDED
jgi:hypothetical protein